MKIWCQTSTRLGKDPMWKSYEESLRRRAQEVARPDTIVSFHDSGTEMPAPDRYSIASHFAVFQYVKGAFQAQAEGYDAYTLLGTSDHGFYEIREITDIPVTFITEASLYVACLMAPRFAFVTHNEVMLPRMTEVVKRYGLTERMVPGGCLNFQYKEFASMYKDPQPYLERTLQVAREVIARGASVILFSGGPFSRFILDQGIREIDGAPVVDSFGALIKMAELLVDLKKIGMPRMKIGLHSRVTPSREELDVFRRLYGIS